MSLEDNSVAEVLVNAEQFRTRLASSYKKGFRPEIAFLGSFSDGTHYAVVDQYRKTVFYRVNDLKSPGFTIDGSGNLVISIASSIITVPVSFSSAGADGYNQTSILSTATLVVTIGGTDATIVVRNSGANSIWLGSDGLVTISNGLLLKSTDSPIALPHFPASGTLYGICAAGALSTLSWMANG